MAFSSLRHSCLNPLRSRRMFLLLWCDSPAGPLTAPFCVGFPGYPRYFSLSNSAVLRSLVLIAVSFRPSAFWFLSAFSFQPLSDNLRPGSIVRRNSPDIASASDYVRHGCLLTSMNPPRQAVLRTPCGVVTLFSVVVVSLLILAEIRFYSLDTSGVY